VVFVWRREQGDLHQKAQCREAKMLLSSRFFPARPVPQRSLCVPQALCHKQVPQSLLAHLRKTSPKTYHENKREAYGPKCTRTALLCEMGSGGTLGHRDRFCTVKKSAGREAAGAGAELHRSEAVALVKAVRAAAPQVASGERPWCSAVFCLGGKVT